MRWEDYTLIDLEVLVPAEIFERGVIYYSQGHLVTAGRIDNVLAGIVVGTSASYQVRLWMEDSKIHGRCNCLYPDFCKHLVTLAFGWIQNSSFFTNLQPLLDDVLHDKANIPDAFTRLVYQNPLSLINFSNTNADDRKTLTPRHLNNLVRHIFDSRAQLQLNNIEVLWDKIIAVEKLLTRELSYGNLEAINLLSEVLDGIVLLYTQHRLPELVTYFNRIITLTSILANYFGPGEIQELYRNLIELYFRPDLWELKNDLREAILILQWVDTDYISNYFTSHITANQDDLTDVTENNLPRLIGFYELLAFKTVPEDVSEQYLKIVTKQLNASLTGRLWLIDQTIPLNLEAAYRLTKDALLSGIEPKGSFRERLIRIHCQRNEFKQAASLSFIQFQEEPNFEEYLRLKNLLSNHPDDFNIYIKRLQTFLENHGDEMLLLNIAIDQGDTKTAMLWYLQSTDRPEALTKMTELLLENGSMVMTEIYPIIIGELLNERAITLWNMALRMITHYKKHCVRTKSNEEWQSFRIQLLENHQNDPRFHRKFGHVLVEL